MNLNDLQPKEVFRFFYEICRIPHGSYNIDAISDFMAKFGITSISEETLVKDYQRYRDRMRPHVRRQYSKSDKKL